MTRPSKINFKCSTEGCLADKHYAKNKCQKCYKQSNHQENNYHKSADESIRKYFSSYAEYKAASKRVKDLCKLIRKMSKN
jgi:histone acetyltransferase (RNA polymerase elongator complex component)